MQFVGGRPVFSASDLNDYLECRRLTELEALVARGVLSPPANDDERAELIRKKGEEHEKRHLERLRKSYGNEGVVEFERSENTLEAFHEAERHTLAAMQAGVQIIYQATFFDGQFLGRSDFLHRVEGESNLGNWRYEVLDTKLALKPKPYFLVQLCNYGEHLKRLQGKMPEHGSIVLGDGSEERYRLHDYLAYYHHLKENFLECAQRMTRSAEREAAIYPHPRSHCQICTWNADCELKRRHDDHLSLVAWMRRDQIDKLNVAGITTVEALARATDPDCPADMNPETFFKLRRQALLQIGERTGGRPIYELLQHAPPLGFALLPAPAAGDVFFDMEGDPLFEPGRGLEYLFGCWLPDDKLNFRAFWGRNRNQEKTAFEDFVDFIVARRRNFPSMHVYHYAPYEKNALRKLAQAHCTREDEVDDLLRGEVLVDLYAVVRQALVLSREHYGLKDVEHFYALERRTDVKKGDESIVMFERWLESGETAILDDILAYNRDDCESTYRLREWLMDRRAEAMAQFGTDIPLRTVKLPHEPCHTPYADGCKTCAKLRADERERQHRSDLERELLRNVLPPQNETEYQLMAEEKRASYLLANILAYHRREEKPAYWQYFDRREDVDGLQRDKEAIAGLQLRTDVAPVQEKKSFIYTYAFPNQPYKLEEGDTPHDPATEPYKTAGLIVGVDEERNLLRLKRTGTIEAASAIASLIPRHPLPTEVQRDALLRIGESFYAGRLQVERPATFDLLTARDPRLRGISEGETIQPKQTDAEAVSAVAQLLERSYLFIQGPPGSGKTTKGAHIICDLLQQGKRVGITSTGHTAMHNLLVKVECEMAARKANFCGRYKYSESNTGSQYVSPLAEPFIANYKDNAPFDASDYELAAGTSWLFAREELEGVFDYLFIDEAGQVSFADALAVSASAHNIVLLGDPSQLAHVSQGVHPLHVADSILQHLLGDSQTVPLHRGVFLNVSYRMQPEICAYVSDSAYEGRLEPDPVTLSHAVIVGGMRRAGLEYVGIDHDGNSSASREEADAVVREIVQLLEGEIVDSSPPEQSGRPRRLEQRDVIVVSPYNAQRRLITRTLRRYGLSDVEVGTVDKFQGREAAVVFYSMATSSGEDVPRDMEFLFERNRFNVAVSRARALSVLVCSPRLLDVACRTPEQMALANLLCAFVEQASASPEQNLADIRTLDGVTP